MSSSKSRLVPRFSLKNCQPCGAFQGIQKPVPSYRFTSGLKHLKHHLRYNFQDNHLYAHVDTMMVASDNTAGCTATMSEIGSRPCSSHLS